MLTNLYIKDFAIVEHLDLEIDSNMTTITGETGAGKSISIDALGLCLGNRAEASMVRNGADKTEVCVTFNVANIPAAINWLTEQDLYEAEQQDCIIRRVISAEGRSRAYINGAPVPAQLLKELAPLLVNIHGQHAHQLLLKPEYQLGLLDQYAGHKHLISQTTLAYQGLQTLTQTLKKLEQEKASRESRRQLLEYQVSELDEFNLQAGEYEIIDTQYKRLSNASALVSDSQACYAMLAEPLDDEPSVSDLLLKVQHKLNELTRYDDKLSNITTLINEACIQVDEAGYELKDYVESLEPDPARLLELEERLTLTLSLARKHKVTPETLHEEHAKLSAELASIKASEQATDLIQTQIIEATTQYKVAAAKLSKNRIKFAKEISVAITKSMQSLNMQQGKFEVVINQIDKHSKLGSDQIEFLVCANPGQPLQPLGKVASGGELSRISLAIQVLTASKIATPTLIFDEVDVGISGGTAAIVGQMLRKIGESAQVMCVTHLPQVAACGHHQMQVYKQNNKKTTQTTMRSLTKSQRVEELARLLGGDIITKNTLENARELLVG